MIRNLGKIALFAVLLAAGQRAAAQFKVVGYHPHGLAM